MDIRQMMCFAAVVADGSYSKAAERLCVTRQALSKTVAKLEEETGLALLDADERGTHVTKRGQEFLDEIAPLLASYELLSDKYGLAHERPVMRLAVSQGALHPFPDDFVSAFIEAEPDIDVHIEEIHSEGTLAMVERGDAEIGLLGTHPKYLDGFESVDLAHPGFYISVPTGSPLASRSQLDLDDLDGVPFITLGSRNHLHQHFAEQCDGAHVQPRILVATSDMHVFEHFRAKESALAFACAPTYTQPFRDVVYIRLAMDGADLFGTYAIHRRGGTLTATARRFWSFILAYRAEHPELLDAWRSQP